MATWADPRGDLRTFLADGPNDNLVKEKEVMGPKDASNRTFFTFEDRLTSSGVQSGVSYPLKVYVDGSEYAASGINIIDQVRGQFQLTAIGGTAPGSNARVTATYYYQQHFDSELDFYLAQAAAQVNSNTASNVPLGLQAAAIRYAACTAHSRLAERWLQRKSEQFMLNEQPKEGTVGDRVAHHVEMAKFYCAAADDMRKSFYEDKLGKAHTPAFGLLKRTPRNYGPKW